MIFNEIYGCYYNAVAKMIHLAIDGKLTEKEMNRIVAEEAYDESVLFIIPAIRKQFIIRNTICTVRLPIR